MTQPYHSFAHAQRTSYSTDTCSVMFIAALFTIARKCNQPKCLLTDEWIMKRQYMHPMEYSTAIKSNKIMKSAYT